MDFRQLFKNAVDAGASDIQPQVRQVFAITRLDRLFDFTTSVEAATS